MPRWLFVILGSVFLVTSVCYGVYVIVVGLESANRTAGVISVILGIVGLGLGMMGLVPVSPKGRVESDSSAGPHSSRTDTSHRGLATIELKNGLQMRIHDPEIIREVINGPSEGDDRAKGVG